jgi:hypothetical protein
MICLWHLADMRVSLILLSSNREHRNCVMFEALAKNVHAECIESPFHIRSFAEPRFDDVRPATTPYDVFLPRHMAVRP